MIMKSIKMILGCYLASLLLGGCTASDESALKTAVEGRWDAMIRGDSEQAYHYYTDSFQETTPLEMFRHKFGGSGLWKEAQAKAISCDESGKHCEVSVEVKVSMRLRGLPKPMDSSTILKESWVRQGWFSDWRYVDS